MELRFDRALCWVGCFLIAVGLMANITGFSGAPANAGFYDAIPQAFTSVYSSFFSGVMMGAGASLLVCGFLSGSKRRLNLPLLLFLSSIFCICISIVSISLSGEHAYWFLLLFFSGIMASFTFMMASVVSLFFSMVKKCAFQPCPPAQASAIPPKITYHVPMQKKGAGRKKAI